ncbi:MAG: hypothetical protein HN600_10130 [Bacteroidetes bacterium]|nr:hypothetical protein [Bacteroidota bacterium]
MASLFQKIKHVYLKELKKKVAFFFSIGFDAFGFMISNLFFAKTKESAIRSIVYVMDKAQPHIFRLADRISKIEGYQVKVLTSEKAIYFADKSALDYSVLYFRNIWHLKLLLKRIPSIYIVHFFHPLSVFASKIVKYAKYKTIVDWKDVSLNYYGFNPPFKYLRKDIPHEKYAMTHADGIIARSYEPHIAIRRYQIEKKPSNLFFLEYCDNSLFVPQKKKIVDPDDIHLVYIGGVKDMSANLPESFLPIINELNRQKIHFHIYPGQNRNWHVFSDYKKKAEELEYFHWHESIKPAEIASEISQYHFGLIPFFTDELPELNDKRSGAMNQKLFNYLEAALPIIIGTGPLFQIWLINRYRVGLKLSRDKFADLRSNIDLNTYQQMQERVLKSREILSLDANMNRLLQFYENVSSTKTVDK